MPIKSWSCALAKLWSVATMNNCWLGAVFMPSCCRPLRSNPPRKMPGRRALALRLHRRAQGRQRVKRCIRGNFVDDLAEQAMGAGCVEPAPFAVRVYLEKVVGPLRHQHIDPPKLKLQIGHKRDRAARDPRRQGVNPPLVSHVFGSEFAPIQRAIDKGTPQKLKGEQAVADNGYGHVLLCHDQFLDRPRNAY